MPRVPSVLAPVAAALLVASAGAAVLAGCARPEPGPVAEDPAARVERLLAAEALPERAEVLADAEALVAHVRDAPREVAGPARAKAGRLLERLYRRDGKARDAEEALEHLAAAGAAGDCGAGIRAALLEAELRADPALGAARLAVLAERAPSCAEAAARAAAPLAGFPPAGGLLDALAGRGDAGAGAGPTRLLGVETWSSTATARVVVHVDRRVGFRVGEEPSGGAGVRFVVDLDGVAPGDAPGERAAEGVVSAVRLAPASTGTRVRIDAVPGARLKVFQLPEPFRVVLDLDVPRLARGPSRSVARVALDAGHGGYDPGAKGAGGLREKDVTLAVARRAAALLERQGLAVTLTRPDDTFVSLEERTARANAAGADLFVSIHCNAAEVSTKHGLETYVLDTTSNAVAARVASRENGASARASEELGRLLAAMRLADQGQRSVQFAGLLQRAAVASVRDVHPRAHDGGVHQAGFYVLVGARMPAVLFETSYVSNPQEESLLGQDAYRDRLADGIANAVRAYREGR